MEHSPLTGQGIRPFLPDDSSDLFKIFLRYKKSLHADHGTSHKWILIISCNSQFHIHPVSCNTEDDRISNLQIHNRNHGRRNVYLTLSDFFRRLLPSGQIIVQETVSLFARRPADHLTFTV